MITINKKKFQIYISEEKIKQRVKQLGEQISKDYDAKDPLIIGVLNGSLYFLADLTRDLSFEAELSLVRYQSYVGTESSGEFNVSLDFDQSAKGRDVILVEDIIDTGATLSNLIRDLKKIQPTSIEIVSLLYKPTVFKESFVAKYIGFEIPEKFVLGYGLDYDGRGRNLRDIYDTLVKVPNLGSWQKLTWMQGIWSLMR